MILPDGAEDMTEDEIVEELMKYGIDREGAELYASLAKDPDPGFEIE